MNSVSHSSSHTGRTAVCGIVQRKANTTAVCGDRHRQPAHFPARNQLRWQSAQPCSISRVASARSTRLICRADGVEGVQRLPEGTRVRVTRSIEVYHAPKRKEGLDLEGMEGEIVAHVDMYKGKQLSSNMPIKVQFLIDNGGKETKFFSHLAEDEIEAI